MTAPPHPLLCSCLPRRARDALVNLMGLEGYVDWTHAGIWFSLGCIFILNLELAVDVLRRRRLVLHLAQVKRRVGASLDPARRTDAALPDVRVLRSGTSRLGHHSCTVDLHEVERQRWIDELQRDLGILGTGGHK